MRLKKVIFFFLIMFFIKNPTSANYNKSFYDLKINSIDGELINLSSYKDKVVLLVNVASYCGFTKQYEDLQVLWETYKDKGLIVMGVPSKSFNQEKESNEEVKKFCEVNFNINFPLTSIYDVKGKNSHEIYKWAKILEDKFLFFMSSKIVFSVEITVSLSKPLFKIKSPDKKFISFTSFPVKIDEID